MLFRTRFDSDNLNPPPTDMSKLASEARSPFQNRLATATLPPPGNEHFIARRALWRTPGSNPPCPTEPNASRKRLEALLAQPDALEDDGVWDAGVNRVWDGLIAGARLKHRLPLALVLKILLAGWIQEGTWPRGAVVPESDDEVTLSEVIEHMPLSSTATPTLTMQASRDDTSRSAVVREA
ncbi:hypothetical protein BD310DRAFT_915294 [Dichomitus squalens]|uniref:DUF4050 domain-containing protein n=1 Tax=Dichomitus squalens TaxID=114155 RepID=A0A4Q9Q914_9APHY|nr:hypothetical protein BD310DRAFT_915294 [Dichomitus squalens]